MESLLYLYICDWAQLKSQLGIVGHAVNCYSHLTKTPTPWHNKPVSKRGHSLPCVRPWPKNKESCTQNTQHIFLYNIYFQHFSFRATHQLCQRRAHVSMSASVLLQVTECLGSTHLITNQNEQSNAELIYTRARSVRKAGKLLPDYMASQRWRQKSY